MSNKDAKLLFLEPVDTDEYPEYLEKIAHPMDFGTIKIKLDTNVY
jgi:hypothetical protein